MVVIYNFIPVFQQYRNILSKELSMTPQSPAMALDQAMQSNVVDRDVGGATLIDEVSSSSNSSPSSNSST